MTTLIRALAPLLVLNSENEAVKEIVVDLLQKYVESDEFPLEDATVNAVREALYRDNAVEDSASDGGGED